MQIFLFWKPNPIYSFTAVDFKMFMLITEEHGDQQQMPFALGKPLCKGRVEQGEMQHWNVELSTDVPARIQKVSRLLASRLNPLGFI